MHADTVAGERFTFFPAPYRSYVEGGFILQEVQEANSFRDKSSSWDVSLSR